MDSLALFRGLLLTAAALSAALPAVAQTPRIEVSGGYQFLNVSADLESIDTGDVPVRNVDQSLPTGWYVDLAGNLNRHFGVVFEAGGNYKSISESAMFAGVAASATADLRVHEFMGGVRYNSRANPTVIPFGQFLVGAVNGSAKVTASGSVTGLPGFSFSGEASGTDLALQAGGGMQLRLTDKLGVRVGADYLHILADEGGVNAFRFAAGIVLAR
jgi:opacity protein-like surface antigen